MSRKKEPEFDIEALKQEIDAQVHEQLFKLTPQSIEEMVREEIGKHAKNAILSICGFEENWDGKFELDHCNGRAGESLAGDFIRKTARAEVEKWLTEQMGALPKLDRSTIMSLRKEYKDALRKAIRERVVDLAETKAERQVNNLKFRLNVGLDDPNQEVDYVSIIEGLRRDLANLEMQFRALELKLQTAKS